ncbi:MAG: sugar ABC transporter permease [Chloroflexota bacterium]|nr:sugar ABC transporter permease [Chloroflexota bacterium]MDE2909332.1 sugar ABC transporter permease [Chloroflexota bacterium]
MRASSRRKPLVALLQPYLLIAPTLVLVLMFNVVPAIRTVNDSLHKPARGLNAAGKPPEFVGTQNFRDLFDHGHYMGSRFLRAFRNTIVFALATVTVGVPLGLLLALLFNHKQPLLGVWRFAVFYPSLLPLIGAASIWSFIFSDSIGLANAVLRSLGHPGLNWLGDRNLVLLSVIVVNIWKQAGYFMIFFLAGLQNIPRDLYEAASLDGAGEMQQFAALTLPLLRRTLLFVIVIAFIFAFQTVEQLQALGEGGPNDSANLLLYLIFQNISERRSWGYVNAMTIVLIGVVLTFTISNFLLFERDEND